jgi:hypothetical protein
MSILGVMTESKPIWWDWIDTSAPGGMPLKLKQNAPVKIKKSFKEWQKEEAKYNKEWEDAYGNRPGLPEKELQELIERINKEIP